MLAMTEAAADIFLEQAEKVTVGVHDKIGEWVKDRPMLLLIMSVGTVVACCLSS